MILTVNVSFAFNAAKLGGKMNLDEGMLSTLGMEPTGAELHDPPKYSKWEVNPGAPGR